MYRKILVPLDGSELAELALSHAHALAERTGAEIALLRIAVPRITEVPTLDTMMPSGVVEFEQGVQARVQGYLDHVALRLHEGGIKVSTEFRYGPVAATILDFADEIHADLIVMSTHGRSGLARWLIGSVAEKIVQGARVPVLLVRPTNNSA